MEMAGPWAGGCEQCPPWCLTTAGPPPSSHPPPPSTFGKIVLRPEEREPELWGWVSGAVLAMNNAAG